MGAEYCYKSPLCSLLIKENSEGITDIEFVNGKSDNRGTVVYSDAGKNVKDAWHYIPGLIARLDEYFAGKRVSFDDIPVSIKGTEFQLSVWDELRNIPYGETATYGDIARRIGNARAFRAVGMACNKNPVPIIIPCHRVIGADGSLTGFGGGLDKKEKLLKLEHI